MFNEIIFSSNILLSFWCQFDLIRYILVLSPLKIVWTMLPPFFHDHSQDQNEEAARVCLFVQRITWERLDGFS